MKIERIYIENFGKLSKFSLSPSDGFNVIFGNNEDGKTTVMSFIRLMFYGSGTTKGDLLCNLRRRFAPLSGEKSGGQIDFTHEGRGYTLTKQFGKTPRSDKILLIDRAKDEAVPLPDGRDVGELFFSMGAGAFERSIYIGSLPPFADGGREELSQKLAATVYSSDTGEGYELVRKRLSDAALKIHTPRKVGIADLQSAKITDLQKELYDSLEAENHRKVLQSEAERLSEELSAAKREREEIARQSELIASLSARDAIKRELASRAELKALSDKLGGFNRDKEKRIGDLEKEIAVLSARLEEGEKITVENDVETALSEAFEHYEAATRERERLDAEKTALEQEIAALEDAPAKPAAKGYNPSLLFTASALFLLSAVCGSFATLTFLTALIPALLFFILGINAKNQNSSNALTERERLAGLKTRRAELSSALSDAEGALNRYSERISLLRERRQNARVSEERRRASTLEAREKLTALSAEKASLTGGKTDGEIAALSDTLVAFEGLCLMLEASPYRAETDENLEKTLAEFSSVSDERIPSEEELKVCSRKIDARLEELTRELSRAKTQSEQLFKTRRGVAVIERDIDDAKRELSKTEAHYDALMTATELLDAAFLEMRKSFAPELNRLTAKYFEKVTDGRYKDASVTSEFEMSVRQDGEILPLDGALLSAGSRDQLDLCLRLALARLTGGENRLPLLLDDPLSDYDEPRTAAALQLISEYSADTQVLFFTCHSHVTAAAKQAGASAMSLL